MTIGLLYGRDGEPISREQWSALFSDTRYKTVAVTKRGDVMVSTVWLGLNHSFRDDGPPLIFETMVFDDGDSVPGRDGDCDRYSTEAEAVAGHAAMCARWGVIP